MKQSMIYIRWKAVSFIISFIFIFFLFSIVRIKREGPATSIKLTAPTTVERIIESEALRKASPAETTKPTSVAEAKSTKKVTERPVPLVQTIMYMEGWIESEDFYNGNYNVLLDINSVNDCGHFCTSVRIGEIRFAAADVVVFQPSSLKLAPPRKHPHQYWVLHSFSSMKHNELKNFQEHNYADVIDYYMLRPPNVNTPLFFNKQFNSLTDDGVDEDTRIMRYFNRHPSFNIVQMVSVCELLSEEGYAQMLTDPLGQRLHEMSSEGQLHYVNICFEVALGIKIPDGSTFVVLDESDCYNSLVEQLVALVSSNSDAIPVLPTLSEDILRELRSVAPPKSFISLNDFANEEELFKHLQNVIEDSSMFLQYHKWKASTTAITQAGKDPLKSAVCKFCQLGYERPPVNQFAAFQKCDSLV